MKILLVFLLLAWRTVEARTLEIAGYDFGPVEKESFFPTVEATTGSSSVCPTVLQTYNNSGFTAYKVDETIQLACSLTTSDFPLNISLFYLVHYGTDERREPTFKDGKQAVFEIESATINDTGLYDCYYGDCTERNPDLTSFRQIWVVDLIQPDLECISTNVYNWSAYNITCTWSRSDDRYFSTWLLQYASQSLWSETLQPFQNCTSTQYYPSQSCSFIVDHFWTLYRFEIHLKEDLFIGGRSFNPEFNYTIPVNASIVKANLVVELRSSAEGSREMTLAWQFDGSTLMISDSIWCNVHHRKRDEWSPLFSESFLISPATALTNYIKNVRDLEPFTVYTFELRIRPTTSPYWSDPAITEGQTLPEAPADLPTNVGYSSHVLVQNQNWREIFLYWEPLPPRFWHGPNGLFIVNVTCDECVPVTEEFPANSSLYTTELVNHFLNDKAYDLTIQTENSVGLSEKTLQVHIPALDNDNKPDLVQSVEREPDVYDVVVTDTKSRSSGVSYTLYWCQGYNVPFCVGNYHNQQSSVKNFTIKVNQSSAHFPWFFGASVQDRNQSSSIVWTSDQFYMSSSLQVPQEEDDSQIKITVGVIGGLLGILVLIIIVFKLHQRLRKRMQELDIKDIIIETDQNRNDIRQIDSDSEESLSLTDSIPADDLAIVAEDEPHIDGFEDTDRAETLDTQCMLGNPDSDMCDSHAVTEATDGHLESKSKNQSLNAGLIYVQNEMMATNNDVERRPVSINDDFVLDTDIDDQDIHRAGKCVQNDTLSEFDIALVKINNVSKMAQYDNVASKHIETEVSLVCTKDTSSTLPAYVQCTEIPSAMLVRNGYVSNGTVSGQTEVVKSSVQSVASYVHASASFRDKINEEQPVITEDVADYSSKTVFRNSTLEKTAHMTTILSQQHKDEQIDNFHVMENQTKFQGLRTSSSVFSYISDKNSGYVEHDCKGIVKPISTDKSVISDSDGSPCLDNIELTGISTLKHLSSVIGSSDCSPMDNDSKEMGKATHTDKSLMNKSDLGDSPYIDNIELTIIANTKPFSGTTGSFGYSSMSNGTINGPESTYPTNATSYIQHENIDITERPNKLSGNASRSSGSSYVSWNRVATAMGKDVNTQDTCPPYVTAMGRDVNTQDTCPPYVTFNSEIGLTQAKPREHIDNTAVEADSRKNVVKSNLSKITMELPLPGEKYFVCLTANTSKDSVSTDMSFLSQLSDIQSLDQLEIGKLRSRKVSDVEKNVSAPTEENKNADNAMYTVNETNNVGELNSHTTTCINDESKYVAKGNDIIDVSEVTSYTKACLVETEKDN